MAYTYNVDTSDLGTRSLLMRLYHSRHSGEDFYHANLVNGEAPALAAAGWIERWGDGWRMTDAGVSEWAEMNRHHFSIKHYGYKNKIFDEMRERLTERGSEMVGICKVDGCGQPRHVSIGGHEFTYCIEHQREQWAAAKRDEGAKKKAEKTAAKPARPRATQTPVKTAGQWVDAEPAPAPQLERVTMGEAERLYMEQEPLPMDEQPSIVYFFNTPTEVVDSLKPAVQALMRSSQEETAGEIHETANAPYCESCYAKAVVETLRAKSPKLAALIDAMEQEQRAAHELGL